MVAVMDFARADAIDAGERHAADDALRAEEIGEGSLVSQAVLEGEDGRVVTQQRRIISCLRCIFSVVLSVTMTRSTFGIEVGSL